MKRNCVIFGHAPGVVITMRGYHRIECPACGDYYENKWEDSFWKSSSYAVERIFMAIAAAFLVVILLIIVLKIWFDWNSCNTYHSMGVPSQWNLWVGCMAEHPKFGWIPVEDYFRVINLYTP